MVKVQAGLRPQLPDPAGQGARIADAAIKAEFEARRAELEKVAAPSTLAAQALRREAEPAPTVQIVAEGRRGRPAVRLGRHRRHRRGA
ncbi:MAG: hypothetical protein MZV65_14560 [Chromatiales bacterium]|nr:hypothetical protein [Chromatiales bacterium]